MDNIFVEKGFIAFQNLSEYFYFFLIVPRHISLFSVLCHIGKGGGASLKQKNECLHLWVEPVDKIVHQLHSTSRTGAYFLVDPKLIKGLFELNTGVAFKGNDFHTKLHSGL